MQALLWVPSIPRSLVNFQLREQIKKRLHSSEPYVTRTWQHPWLRPEWKNLLTVMGQCSNTNYVRRFQCEDKNVDLMRVQPHFYRVRQVEQFSSWHYAFITTTGSVANPRLVSLLLVKIWNTLGNTAKHCLVKLYTSLWKCYYQCIWESMTRASTILRRHDLFKKYTHCNSLFSLLKSACQCGAFGR